MEKDYSIFSGRSNLPLAEEIASHAGMTLGPVESKNFSDGEIWIQYNQSIRGQDVFIIQSTDTAESIIELLIMLDAAKHAKARRIIAVIPYFGYSRQDTKDKPRCCMSGKLLWNLIESSGATHLILAELHNPALTNAATKTFDHLYLSQKLWPEFSHIPNLVVVNLDAGGSKMARFYAAQLKAERATGDKIRDNHNKVKDIRLIGDVKGKNVLIIDDLDDTSGTVIKGVSRLKEEGARGIYFSCIHAVLSGQGLERLTQNKHLKKIVFTNTLNRTAIQFPDKIKIISAADIFATAIINFHSDKSIDSLFDQNQAV